jgi:cobalt-zinc-cadmium efflux system outer membrane protein
VVKTTIRFAAAILLSAGPFAARADAQVAPAAPLTFSAALDLAASRNLDLAAIKRQRAIREAQVRVARQWANPAVGFEVTKDSPHENLTFDFPLPLGGVRGRQIDLAKEELTLADVDEKAAMRTLRRNVRQTFYGVLGSDQRLRLAEEVVGLVKRTREAAQARFEEGAGPRLDVLAADLGLARAESDLALARSARAAALAGLNAVLNQPPGEAVAVVGHLADAPPPPDFAGAMALAATSNGELMAAEREAAIEARRLSLIRAERVPQPTVTFGLPMNAPGEFTVGAAVGVAMNVPLFNRSQGEIAASQATIVQIHARRDAARRTVESAVFSALARIDAQRQRVESFRTRVIPAATELADLAEESYKAGRSPLLMLIEAQRALRDAKRDFLDALEEFQAALADLEEVIGGPIA